MTVDGGKVAMKAHIGHETNNYRAGGYVSGGYIVSHANRAELWFATREEAPSLSIEISNLTNLPALLASLALDEPGEDTDETPEEFNQRLKMWDDLAKALEDAAFRLRQAPRK